MLVKQCLLELALASNFFGISYFHVIVDCNEHLNTYQKDISVNLNTHFCIGFTNIEEIKN